MRVGGGGNTVDKSPMQRGFIKNNAGDVLPALRFLGRLCNVCNFVIMFSLITMVYRKAICFTDLKIIEYCQKNVWLK